MENQQNLKLLMAIRECGMRQSEFAKAVGDHFTFVSRVVNGWINLDDRRQQKYARVLKKQVKDIFN